VQHPVEADLAALPHERETQRRPDVGARCADPQPIPQANAT
jgi:hypothetical protein